MFIIKTRRLMLRDFTQEDWISIHEYASDPEVTRYVGWGPNNAEDTTDFLKRVLEGQISIPRENYELAVVLNDGNMLIGAGRITVSDKRSHEGWIGYVLNRKHWGRGYATELAEALIAFGFNEMSLHRIYATCDIDNFASAHVVEKIGMQREGRLREYGLKGRNWRDQYIYAILEREFGHMKKRDRKDSKIDLEKSRGEV
jgi:RimJ/RimL family protein N-acetyltransferase